MSDVPDDLADDGRGARFWSAAVGEYRLRCDELELLAEACRLLDLQDRLREAVEADGIMVSGSRGQLAVNPALTELRQVRHQTRLHLSALKLPDPDVEDESRSLTVADLP